MLFVVCFAVKRIILMETRFFVVLFFLFFRLALGYDVQQHQVNADQRQNVKSVSEQSGEIDAEYFCGDLRYAGSEEDSRRDKKQTCRECPALDLFDHFCLLSGTQDIHEIGTPDKSSRGDSEHDSECECEENTRQKARDAETVRHLCIRYDKQFKQFPDEIGNGRRAQRAPKRRRRR